MNFEDLAKIQDETERVKKTYELFNEDARLNHSKAARVEFLTTMRYLQKSLFEGAKILDLGAGAGEYSIALADMGYSVSALELSPANIEAFRKKIKPHHHIDLKEGNALDLSSYEAESFDVVLMLGPLYHLSKREDQIKCIQEAKRVVKKDGVMFFGFITNDFVILTEFMSFSDYFENGDYDKKTFKLHDFPFVFHTVPESQKLLEDAGICIERIVAADGASELLSRQINALSDEGYAQYLRYHEYMCEKPEFLGMTSHLLMIGRKN